MEAGPEPLTPEPKESRLSRFLARRWAVPAVIAGAVAIGAVACLAPDLVARWQLSRERDRIRARGEPATLAELSPQMPPDDDNAAVLLPEAFKLMDAASASEPADWMDFLFEEGHPRRADAEAAIKIHAKAMALARKALERPRCVFDLDYTKGAALELPHLAPLRHLARLFAAEAILNALDGKGPEAADGIRQVFLLVHALDEEPLAISKLVALAAAETGMDAMKKIEAGSVPDDDEHRLLTRMAASLDFAAAATQSLLYERVALVAVRGSDFASQGSRAVRWYVTVRASPSHAQLVRVMRLMAEAIEASRRPPWEALPVVSKHYRQVYDTLPWTDYICLPAIGDPWKHWYRPFVRAMAKRDAAVIGLSCELFRSAKGRYPATLDELAPEVLDKLLADPFTGKPLRYELRDGGRAFIVYSVGDNLKDDGGVEHDHDKAPGSDDISWQGRVRSKSQAPLAEEAEGE